MRRTIWSVLVLLFLVRPVVRSQITSFQPYGLEAGLLSTHLTDLVEDAHGYIWVTTYGAGISRFDGEHFTNYADPVLMGSLYFHSAITDPSGLWFGGENVLARYHQGSWSYYPVDGAIFDIETGAGRLWLATSQGLQWYDLEANRWGGQGMIDEQVSEVYFWEGQIWAASRSGIFRCGTRGCSEVIPMPLTGEDPVLFCKDYEGQLWLSSRPGGLKKWRDGAFESVVTPEQIPGTALQTLVAGDLGSLFGSTDQGGLMVWQGIDSTWRPISAAKMWTRQASAMIYDRWNNGWIATRDMGLIKYASTRFQLLQGYPELSGRVVIDMNHIGDHAIISYQNGATDQISPNGELTPGPTSLILWELQHPDPQVDTLVGWVRSDGVYLRARTADSHAPLILPLHVNEVIRVEKEYLLLATEAGLYELIWRQSTATNQGVWLWERLTDGNVDRLGPWMGDGCWFKQEGKIGYIHDRVIRWMIPDTLNITAAISWEQRYLLLGTRDHGIFCLDMLQSNPVCRPLGGNHQLLSPIRSLHVDEGVLWVATRNSLIQNRLGDDLSLETISLLDTKGGLPRVEFIAGKPFSDWTGKGYFPVRNGILIITPQQLLGSAQGPLIHLETLQFGEKKVSPDNIGFEDALLEVSYQERDITVQLAAVDQSRPGNLRFSWRLIGYPALTSWQSPKTGGTIPLYALPPGNYRMEAKAINQIEIESDLLILSFQVLKPFWLKGWFIALLSGCLIAVLYMFYKWRMTLVERRNLEVTQRLVMENKLYRLEHAALRLQMNPHFIFNVIQSIAARVTKGDAVTARQSLQAFARLLRHQLQETRYEYITLEDEIAGLEDYLSLEKQLKAGRFDYQIRWPENLDPSFLEIPTMLIQPFVENAIKHGLPQDGKKGKIDIHFYWKGKLLFCDIEDNGPGFGESIPRQGHESTGIDITRERLNLYHRNRYAEPLKIQVLEETWGIKGTLVSLILPVKD